MIAIALVDQKWGIAVNGKQVICIPEDLKRFKKITESHPVIMGRKTYEALPGKKPLPGRRNLILSRNMKTAPEGFELGSLMANDPDTCVIGGESVYAQLLPLCDHIYLTVVEYDFDADQFFPNITYDESEWELKSRGPDLDYNGYTYHFDEYHRKGSFEPIESDKFTEKDLQQFNNAEILAVAETLIQQAQDEYKNEEARASAILANLVVLCYSQGMNATCHKGIDKFTCIDDIFADVIAEAQMRWEWIITYCRDVLSIDLHPLAMLFVLQFITSSKNDPYAPHVLEGIARVNKRLDEKIAEDVKVADAESDPEIENFDGCTATLVVEYFSLLEKLGTFHRDRDRYETEEQKKLHDRIVAIYHRIGRT